MDPKDLLLLKGSTVKNVFRIPHKNRFSEPVYISSELADAFLQFLKTKIKKIVYLPDKNVFCSMSEELSKFEKMDELIKSKDLVTMEDFCNGGKYSSLSLFCVPTKDAIVEASKETAKETKNEI